MKIQSLISPNTCSKLFSKIVITDTQRKAQEKWLNLLETGKLEKEKENYPVFMNTILRDLLGFPEELIEKAYEQKNVEFAFKDPQNQWAVLFEAKGYATRNLFANQGRVKTNQATPIKQTFDNLGRFEFIKYGVCTNYQKFILMDYNLKFSALQEFDFKSTENNDEKLKEFIGIFCYKTLVINKDILKFKSESDNADKELSTEFYKLFHETRLMLIKAFKEKPEVSEIEAIYYAQRFLERILFLFFALDNGLIDNPKLFRDRILNQLKLQQSTEDSKKIFNDIKLIFNALDKGSQIMGIDGFNGELFSGKIPDKIFFLDFQSKSFFANEIMNSKLSKELKLHGDAAEIWKEFGKNVNPIIRNLLIMDSRNFNSELNVTILGHILEQSLDDLSKLQKTGDIKRKIEGVYYTPSNLTDYICRNTIIPYLSKSNTNDIHELILEYQNDIETLENKVEKIRIVDPACGSGAFLIKAAQVMLEITEGIELIKEDKTAQKKSGTLEDWQVEQEVSKIIKNNIFGVDINRDSVEISKLSLFLMMAKPGEKLTNLSQNIIHGNSVIDDKTVDPYGFVWNEKFSKVMKDGGFDVVIGNPPWQLVQPFADEFFSPLKEMQLLLTVEFPNRNQLFSMLPIRKKKALIEKCLMIPEINENWKKYQESYYKQKEHFLNPKNYQFQVAMINGKKPTGIGLNLYKLFLEKAHKILKKEGMIGMITPSGIYSDLGSGGLRKLFFENYIILELCGFVNKKPIFEDVHRQFKFCTLLLKKFKSSSKFLAKFGTYDDLELNNFRTTSFEYDLKLAKISSPEALSIIECKNKKEYDILQKCYKFPLLQDKKWGIKAAREFNMTDDSNLFHTSKIGFPVFEGKMIYQFKNDLTPPKYWIDEEEGLTELKRKEIFRIKKLAKKDYTSINPQLHCHHYRLAWRDITNATNERGLIATILQPNVFLVNSLYYIIPIYFNGEKYIHTLSNEKLLYLCGVLNSFPTDFILRHKISSHANIFYVKELPIPEYDSKNLLHKKIFENTTKLICTSNEFKKLRNEVGISKFVTNKSERETLEAQTNAYAAKIYNLTKEELEYILESFPSVDKNIKELTLDEFSLI